MNNSKAIAVAGLTKVAAVIVLSLICGNIYAIDPTLTVGADACVDCHTPAHDNWVETTHFKTYEELSSSDEANEVADALGIDDIEDPEGTCVGCHFTLVGETVEDLEPISGISCESCHGAAAEWVESHGEYVSGDAESESAAEKTERISAAEAAGQIRPAQINKIAANCLGCHTVPNEKLVNVGGHPAGSAFELVDWSQGEMRHNLFWSNGETNKVATPARKRVLFVVGHATDLEFSLRALGKSSSDGVYRKAMIERVKQSTAHLKAINSKIKSPEVSSALATVEGINLSAAPDTGQINAAADKIKTAIASFTKANNGDSLGALDTLLPAGDGRFSDKY